MSEYSVSGETSSRYAPPIDLSRFALVSIGAALATIALKVSAWWLTDSVGLLSDAAESLVNLVAAVVALYALKMAILPPDKNHPFGHSKAEYFAAAVEGILIFVAATIIIVKALERLLNPVAIDNLGVGLLISSAAAGLNGVVGMFLLRKGRHFNSAALVADGRHLMTDVVTSVGVLIGVGLVAITKQPLLDPLVAMLAGVNILWTGIKLVRSAINGLMDIALSPEVNATIESVLNQFRSADVEFHAIRTRESGNRCFMECHVLVPGAWTVSKGHDFTEDLIDALVERVPNLRVAAHLEPKDDPRSYEDLEI